MTVQMYRGLDRCFKSLDNGIRIIRGYQTGHILNTDTVCAHGLQVLALLDIILQVIYFSAHARLGHGIADTALKMFTALLDDRYHRLEITIIVQGIKGPENIHAVGGGPVHKGPGHIIGIIAVSYQVLRSKQHGKRSFFHIPF